MVAIPDDVDGKSTPLISHPTAPSLVPAGEEESPEESRQDYSPYWSFLSPARWQHQSFLENDDDNDRHSGHALPTAFSKGISWLRVPILLLVVSVVWPYGAISFRAFTHSTDSTFHPIPSSPSGQAQDAFRSSYSEDWSNPMNPSLMVVLESSNASLIDSKSPLYRQAQNFSVGLATHLNDTCWNLNGGNCDSSWIQVTSFFSLKEDNLSWLAQSLVTPAGDLMLISIRYLIPPNVTNARQLIFDLMDVIQSYGDTHIPPNCTVSYTGIKWFQSDLFRATQSDLRRMDALVVPFALVLLGVVFRRQARASLLWILPLVTMITTVCGWSIVMRWVASQMQITQFTPSIMTSLTLGMGIDYTLFLLSRYLELASSNNHNDDDKSNAIRHMLQHGGHVLLLSGLTLMCTFLGLCFLPLAMLRSVGIGAAVAIACCLLVNLTVVPALLHTRFGTWIVKPTSPPPTTTTTTTQDSSFLQRPTSHIDDDHVARTSIWYRLSRHLLHPYKSIIIFLIIIQFLLPVTWYATELKSSLDFDLMLPKASPSLQTFYRLGNKLGYGRTSPYRILFDGHNQTIRMDSEEGFDVMHRVLDELTAIDTAGDGMTHISTGMEEFDELKQNLMDSLGFSSDERRLLEDSVLCTNDQLESTTPVTNYAGIAVLKNVRIPHSLYVAAKYCAQLNPCPVEVLHLIEYVDNVSTSSDRFATFVTATLAVNPFSDEGIQWLESARETFARLSNGGALAGVQVYIEGSAAIEYDAVQAVYSAFPQVVVTTMLVVFFLMGIFFRSIVTPLRSVVSISMTLAFVFGLVVLVFQNGILNWTRVPSWASSGDEISWLVPVMSFSIIVGLALDYDVFLISRILEYRLDHGYDHHDSISAGLHATGGIITAAGVIMAVAFGGLMFSSSPVLYQWSFLLTTAVLLDTFVIRSLVVPIVMGWTGKYSWWPRRLLPVDERLVNSAAESDVSRHSLGPLSPAVGLSRPLLSP